MEDDTPEQTCVQSGTIDDRYWMHAMYRPPDNGLGGQYVTVSSVAWRWEANVGGVFTWTVTGSGATGTDNPVDPSMPEWEARYSDE